VSTDGKKFAKKVSQPLNNYTFEKVNSNFDRLETESYRGLLPVTSSRRIQLIGGHS